MKNYYLTRSFGIGIAALCLVVDYLTKQWALTHLSVGIVTVIPDYFNLILAFNPGVSFSMFADLNGAWVPYMWASLALAASIFFIHMLGKEKTIMAQIGFGGIVGGAIGNMIDRLTHGVVVDFIDLHYYNYHWPAFNIADSAIVVGVGLVLLAQVKEGIKK